MSEFKPRMSKPERLDPYYTRRASGGYSNAIKGYPTDKDCEVLSNCVGYAYGRFNEIGGWGSCKYLKPVNAEKFMQYKGNLESGTEPRIGACMVWQKGATLNGSDGEGHVAIVEKIISDTELVTSESAWGGKAFYTKRRTKGDGRWGMGSAYKFLGFIYNPAPCCKAVDTACTVYTVKKGDTLSKIARTYGTTYQKLAEYNGIANPNLIITGQLIRIPILTAELKVGDRVRIKADKNTYFPNGNRFSKWVHDYDYIIAKTADSGGKNVYRNGERCVLLGDKINRRTGTRGSPINSWCSVNYITKTSDS